MMLKSLTLILRSREAASRRIEACDRPHGSRRAQERAPHHEDFFSNTSGNVTIMTTVAFTMAIAIAALGIDAGSVFADRRKAQSAADLAAIAAAANIANAEKMANATAVLNKVPPNTSVSVETGIYVPSPDIAPPARFTAGPVAGANAVRVTLNTQTPLFFGRMIAGMPTFDIRTRATASTSALATFAIGSRLLALNGGIVNGVLGALLGTSLSLSVMDYDALAKSNIDVFDWMNALAARTGTSSGTYDNLLSGKFKVTDVVAAMITANKSAGGSSASTAALTMVSQSLAGNSTKISGASLVSLGPYGAISIGDKPRVAVSIAALDLLSATAATGNNKVSAGLNAGLPGIASVSLAATIGERPQGTSWVRVGAKGASVHIAQTRVLLMFQLNGTGVIPQVNLPVYIEVASGTATLTALSCGFNDIAKSSATLGVTPGLVDAWIGDVSNAEMKNFSVKPNPPPALLASLAGVSVTGRAHAGIGNMSATPVTFSYGDIQAKTKKTVSTSSFTRSLTATLLGDLSVGVQVGPFGWAAPGVGPAVSDIVANATGSIDQVINAVLATLGVGVGQADVWVTGIRCDGAVLVN